MATLAPFARRFRFPAGVDRTGDRFAEEPDYDTYVRGLIRQVLLTAKGERINRPAFGAGVRRLVFAPLSDASAMLARTMISKRSTAGSRPSSRSRAWRLAPTRRSWRSPSCIA